MVGKVEIANRSLTKLGEDRILLLSDDVKSARTINDLYETVRDAELRRYRWKFALARTQLLALVAAPAWGYQFQYPLPADYLALVQVGEFFVPSCGKFSKPYALEAGVILTNFEAPLKFRYVSKVENTGLYDPLFVEVFACKLAMEACETLTQSSTKFDRCAKQYQFALEEAYRQDAIEGTPDVLPDGSWLNSRTDSEFFNGIPADQYPYISGY